MKKYQSEFNPRQYMVSKDFEIFYYNDTNFSKVKNHTHDYYEFYFFLQGEIDLMVSGQAFPMKAGDVALIPPGVDHYMINRDETIPYRRFIFWVSKNYYEKLKKISDDYSYIVTQANQNGHYIYHNELRKFNILHGKCHRLLEEIHTEHFGKESMVSLCVNDLMLYLNRMAYEYLHPLKHTQNQSLYISIMEYIEEHLKDNLSLDELAGHFYVSKFHIAHIFKENLGLSIHQYITKKRLDMCRNDLLGGGNISKTFLSYGFKDYSSFYRAFKKEYGLSPKEYKELHSITELTNP